MRSAGSGAASVVKRRAGGGDGGAVGTGNAAAKTGAAVEPGIAETPALPVARRLPKLSGAASRLRRAAKLPGIRSVGNPGGQQHRQVNRPKHQCYRESLSWGYVRKRKCNHL